ncbi:MAG: murein DD-endopeptidase MepM/ murein hydrolase activator NlpD, partial [Arenicella sp.]
MSRMLGGWDYVVINGRLGWNIMDRKYGSRFGVGYYGRYIIHLSLMLAGIGSAQGQPIDVAMKLNLADSQGPRGFDFMLGNNSRHTGSDYIVARETAVEAMAFGKVVYRNDMTVTEACAPGNCAGQLDHGMGRIVEIEYLLEDGEKIFSSYNHLENYEVFAGQDTYVTAKEVVASTGASGQRSNIYWTAINNSVPHLHLEMRNAQRVDGVA